MRKNNEWKMWIKKPIIMFLQSIVLFLNTKFTLLLLLLTNILCSLPSNAVEFLFFLFSFSFLCSIIDVFYYWFCLQCFAQINSKFIQTENELWAYVWLNVIWKCIFTAHTHTHTQTQNNVRTYDLAWTSICSIVSVKTVYFR